MGETLDYIKMYARFPVALRRFLRHHLTLEEASALVRKRMAQREENFLAIVQRNIYNYQRSPYLPLLRTAGCEFGDLHALVKQRGLEGALLALRAAGVYYTFEEFKGRVPVVRNGQTLPIKPGDFDNPYIRSVYTAESGGSTGAGTRVAQDLDQLAARAPHLLLTLAAHKLLDAPQVIWRGILPASTLNQVLQRAYFGNTTARWFSNIGLFDSKHWIKYDLATYYAIVWMRMYGVRAPFPQYVTADKAVVVARCVAELLKAHGQCLLSAGVSPSLRVCLAAQEAGLDLRGATVTLAGEPSTPAKIRSMESVGARFLANYALAEAGTLGFGCAQSSDPSDVHLFKDSYALITLPHRVEGFDVTVPAFHLSTLLPTAPKLLLNMQIDDYGIVEERACGCALESYGYTMHLRQIHSYRKLTGEGVTMIGSEMLRILEEVLPAKFGGNALDYQLLEQEDARGFTRLYLVIHPRLQIEDEQAVIEVVMNALRASSAAADIARALWQHAGTLQIKRLEPTLTARGKSMPLHIERIGQDKS